MLELVRLQAILLRQPQQIGDILVKKTEGFDQVFADQAAGAGRLAITPLWHPNCLGESSEAVKNEEVTILFHQIRGQ